MDNLGYVKLDKDTAQSNIYLSDVTRHGSMKDWFDDMVLGNGLKNIKVSYRVDGGSNGMGVQGYENEHYNLEKRLQQLRKSTMPIEDNTQAYHGPANGHHSANHGLGVSVMHGMGGAAAAAQAAGMGFSDFVDLKKRAERYEEIKEQLDKLKDENHSLTLRNRELESDKKTAEKEKELALMLERANKQSFLNSDAGQEILKMLPQLAASMAGNGGQQPQGGHTGMGMPGLSETKDRVIKYLMGDTVSDDTVYLLEKLLVIQMESPQKFNEIKQKIESGHGSNG